MRSGDTRLVSGCTLAGTLVVVRLQLLLHRSILTNPVPALCMQPLDVLRTRMQADASMGLSR